MSLCPVCLRAQLYSTVSFINWRGMPANTMTRWRCGNCKAYTYVVAGQTHMLRVGAVYISWMWEKGPGDGCVPELTQEAMRQWHHPDAKPLLQACIDAPWDEAPYGVYADFLEERDMCPRTVEALRKRLKASPAHIGCAQGEQDAHAR